MMRRLANLPQLPYRCGVSVTLVLLGVCSCRTPLMGADWPQWRANAGRTASTDEQLGGELHLQWVRHSPKPQAVWPKYPRLNFSASYEPVLSGGLLFVPSMIDGSVAAFEMGSGAEKWRYYTNGPVRLAPVVFKSAVYIASDDGYVHCVRAHDGEFQWKVRGAPDAHDERWVLGNDQLCSLWPVRGGPVVADGVLYFAAGIWPGEGVFVRAVEATTGDPVWGNETVGSIEGALDDHGGRWDGGLSPQGYLVVVGDKLIVPCGRAMAAVLNRKNGQLEPYTTHWGGRRELEKGTWFVAGDEDYFYVGGDLYDLSSRKRIGSDPANASKELGEYREPVLADDLMFASLPQSEMRGYRPRGTSYTRVEAWDLSNRLSPELQWAMDGDLKVHCRAGDRLFAAGGGRVVAIDLPATPTDKPRISWRRSIDGKVARMLVANGRLCTVSTDGRISVFGPNKVVQPAVLKLPSPGVQGGHEKATAAAILRASGQEKGHCVVLGNGPLAIELALQSKLRVCAIEPDRAKADKLRRDLNDIGLGWPSVVVRSVDVGSVPLPPYFASLVVSDAAFDARPAEQEVTRLLHWLNPYRGVAYLGGSEAANGENLRAIDSLGLGASVSLDEHWLVVRRTDGPDGAADWSHVNADAGGTLVSRDHRVKAPLTILWFGGESGDMIFPEWDFNHARLTPPLVASGRIFIQVPPMLVAVDIYTGRTLWSRKLPAEEQTGSRPRRGGAVSPAMDFGADARDYRYVATSDSVYVLAADTILRLDARTGEELTRIASPSDSGRWRDYRVSGDHLIGATREMVVCMNRTTGTLRWRRRSEWEVADLAAGSGQLFFADADLPDLSAARRGQVSNARGRLVSLDVRNGELLWESSLSSVKGETRHPLRLAYSELSGIVVSVYNTFDAFEGKTGSVLCAERPLSGSSYNGRDWRQWNQGQPLLYSDRIVGQYGDVYDPRTGEVVAEASLWAGGQGGLIRRGCSRVVGGQHLIAMRSAYAAFWDLPSGELRRISGIRSGCTNSMIPAGGVLSIPNYAHGCACNYPLFSSLALVPREDLNLE